MPAPTAVSLAIRHLISAWEATHSKVWPKSRRLSLITPSTRPLKTPKRQGWEHLGSANVGGQEMQLYAEPEPEVVAAPVAAPKPAPPVVAPKPTPPARKPPTPTPTPPVAAKDPADA